MNIERYECEDVPYLPELEEECLDDYYVEEDDSVTTRKLITPLLDN